MGQPMNILDQIADQMAQREVSLRALARELDLPLTTLHHWLVNRDRDLPEAQAKRIVEHLGGEYRPAQARFPA